MHKNFAEATVPSPEISTCTATAAQAETEKSTQQGESFMPIARAADATTEGRAGPGGFTERTNRVFGIGPIDRSIAHDDAGKAASAAQNMYPNSLHNGRGDASGHCYWNALMARHIGAGQTREVANNHEENKNQPQAEHDMGMFNNAFGRDRVAPDSDSDANAKARCCYSADVGELRTL